MKDPRGLVRQTKHTRGRNSESFDKRTTFVRPDMRVRLHGDGSAPPASLSHDDVVIVPNFVPNSVDVMQRLLSEMNAAQSVGTRNSEYISWHEGCHLIVKDATCSPTFVTLLDQMCEYCQIDPRTASYRYNLYKDDEDWKSFHHDSAAFNPDRARRQNITVGLSFGCRRELAFKHAKKDTLIYFPQDFPQESGMLFTFGKAVNIRWMHGVNGVEETKRTGEARISIILWGLTSLTYDEPDEPQLLENNDRRPSQACPNYYRDFQRGNCRYGEKCRFLHSEAAP